jgi:hypothetical protein
MRRRAAVAPTPGIASSLGGVSERGDHDARVRQLGAVEDLIGGRLPAGYREFVATVGAGGAGPHWGLTSLEQAVREVREVWGVAALGADSPLTVDVDFAELLEAPPDWDEHVTRLEQDPDYAAGWDRLQQTYTADRCYHGRLRIADYGCGDWLFLVVRGPAAGTVWADCTANATGLYCLEVEFPTCRRPVRGRSVCPR